MLQNGHGKLFLMRNLQGFIHIQIGTNRVGKLNTKKIYKCTCQNIFKRYQKWLSGRDPTSVPKAQFMNK